MNMNEKNCKNGKAQICGFIYDFYDFWNGKGTKKKTHGFFFMGLIRWWISMFYLPRPGIWDLDIIN